MKKFFHAALVLPLVLFAVSCSESNDEGLKSVELTGGTSTQQQVYADETGTPAPIRFTAKAAWTASVAEVATKAEAGRVDWLKLSAYSGGAGEVSLTIELNPNLTGQDRKAEIRITCGGTTITVTVEQKGTKQDGTTPEPTPEEPEKPDQPTPTDYALVESIDARFWVGCEENAVTGDYSSTFHYVFHYDDQNRIDAYELSDYNYDNEGTELDYKHHTRFDYSVPGEILLTEHTTYSPNNSQDEPRTKTYRVVLDNQGRATQIKENESIYEKAPITYHYSYNDEGRWSRVSWYDPDESPTEIYEELTYQNGVLSKINYHYSEDDKQEFIFPNDAFSDVPNDRLSIDPNWLIFMEPLEPEIMLPMLRLTGKGCDRLALWSLYNYEGDTIYPSENLPFGVGWEVPNVTVPQTAYYYVHEKTGLMKYTFNDDGTIAKIVQPVACIKMQEKYDIVVGSELVDPNQPDMGYKYTIQNKKRTEVKRRTDTHEWTFTYRK